MGTRLGRNFAGTDEDDGSGQDKFQRGEGGCASNIPALVARWTAQTTHSRAMTIGPESLSRCRTAESMASTAAIRLTHMHALPSSPVDSDVMGRPFLVFATRVRGVLLELALDRNGASDQMAGDFPTLFTFRSEPHDSLSMQEARYSINPRMSSANKLPLNAPPSFEDVGEELRFALLEGHDLFLDGVVAPAVARPVFARRV